MIAMAGWASHGQAQDIDVQPVAEARLRYEHVDEASFAEASDAVTARVRLGAQASAGKLTATVIGQGNLALVDHYFDGLHGTQTRPQIGDPENLALYVAQLRYADEGLAITAGRQKLLLEDERFVGNAFFRNNAQSFDAVRAELAPAKGLTIDLTYAWNARTIWGSHGHGARQQGVGGDNVFAILGYATPIGKISAFAYIVDQNEAQVQGYRLSNQSYGVRLAGARELATGTKLSYQLSHARQSDHHNNPNDYAASYWLADAAIDWRGWKLNAGYEVLGASDGTAFTSFQTPLGSIFKFQGWADKFATTPPDGVRDLYVSGGYGWSKLGPLTGISLQAAWHRLRSDRLSRHYGDEINLLASGKWAKTTLSLRYAHYDAARFSSDTDKLWLQADWAY
ncbi:hypothetical protein GRI97_10755 [Altererythrobacter xixiisoli]|uniref:Alginate export domain-containing protein n=2 Tax=Croceibacterium xixiisoli TaxID=1476466 RepID=A0A6I4TXU8_9SPHN|nr:hypothetical protein [Croceibacterium xixiisoli]